MLNFRAISAGKRVLNVDTEIANGALDLGMAEVLGRVWPNSLRQVRSDRAGRRATAPRMGLHFPTGCESARRFGADRRPMDLILLEIVGSLGDAYSHSWARSPMNSGHRSRSGRCRSARTPRTSWSSRMQG